MEEITQLTVQVKRIDGRSYITILTPENQTPMSIESMGFMLAAAVSLTVRLADNEPDFMQKIMDYLNDEFVNADSFNDAKKLYRGQ
jgi:hypothetical protein